jgi:uncharacterized protein YbaA (DUF1428 family)
MSYVDGFIVPVPNDKRDDYLALARRAALRFKELGALEIVECWGDDVPKGTLTSFPLAVKCTDQETVVFSWIRWPSRDVRDAAHKIMMDDPEFSAATMPFDGKRLIFGGFNVLLQA